MLQALSISRSLNKAKSAAENGEVNCTELRNLVVGAIEEAGGKVDYAEVRVKTCLALSGPSLFFSLHVDSCLIRFEKNKLRKSIFC